MSAADFFRRLPEVPVYRRRDDPVRKVAAERAEEGRTLLTQVQHLGPGIGAEPLGAALEAHLKVLQLLAEGRVEAAEGPWHEALALERAAVSSQRLWSRTDEVDAPVYSRESGESRFDPRPEAAVKVKLACPNSACHKVEDFDFSARHATHQFICLHCQTRFYAYFAELLELVVETKGKNHHRYRFRVREMNGATTRVDFDDANPAVLAAARGDLLAFLYAPRTTLRGVLDLSSSRVLWVQHTGPCFLATAVYGEDAAELTAFRIFRDGVLLPTTPGRLLVRGYYAAGPSLARAVVRRPWLRGLTRVALRGIHRALVRSQRL
jgi:hypothetical protein